jgi:hypothetical protein
VRLLGLMWCQMAAATMDLLVVEQEKWDAEV